MSKATECIPPPIWRHPAEESTDLYPGMVVHDGRVTGSITAGRTRLPLWCLVRSVVDGGFAAAEKEYHIAGTELTADSLAKFLYCLLEQRGEFGRLLCVLADVERLEIEREEKEHTDRAWWEDADLRQRVLEQLDRCRAALASSLEGKE